MFSAATKSAHSAATAANYIEDVFSTYLYTGTGSAQTITNNIDLSTKGGLVWLKSRSSVTDHCLIDTAQGRSKELYSNLTNAADTLSSTNGITAFNTTGFSLGTNWGGENPSGASMASWTFAKQTKFFDIVTYTGNGSNRTISHNLGSVPGCIVVKRTDVSANWQVYHRSLANTQYLVLNSDADKATGTTRWNSTTPTSTVFSLGTDATVNANGGTYVAYIFAHDAGGFGAAGTDNVISCGSYTGNGSATGPTVNLGYEPQYVLIKRTDTAGYSWNIYDSMRAFNVNYAIELFANSSDAEGNYNNVKPTSTGFQPIDTDAAINANGGTYIYIAIRRPMKPPTTGTEILEETARSGTGAVVTVGSSITADLTLIKNRGATGGTVWAERLVGAAYMLSSSGATETSSTTVLQSNPWDVQKGVKVGTTSTLTNASSNTYINYNIKRASGFFDIVCYSGTGGARTITHNLNAVPELMIFKARNNTTEWYSWNSSFSATEYIVFSSTTTKQTSANILNSTLPTSTTISLGDFNGVNGSGENEIVYLFATVAGVSKVGSYTGTGTTQQINCGFTGGARFVLIKRTDVSGGWYVWDSARGIVSGNDPYLLLNSTAAEVTNTDYVDTYSAGFEISSTAPNEINANGGSFIYLAIA